MTAVEWLVDQLYGNNEIFGVSSDLLEQAKEIEKQQMRKCASFWRGKENEIEKPIFEQYYNETFKNQ